MIRACLAGLVLVLAGCQVNSGPGYVAPHDPGPGSMREARAECRDAAAREGFGVRRILDERAIGGSGGRLIGAEVSLRVERRGRVRDIYCDYTFSSRIARLRGGGGGYPDREPDNASLLGEARSACRSEAARQDYRLRRFTRERLVTGRGGRVVGAEFSLATERYGVRRDIYCDYDFGAARARLRDPGPAGGSGGSGGGQAGRPRDGEWHLDRARDLCRQAAEARGHVVSGVTTGERRSVRDGRLVWVEKFVNIGVRERRDRLACRYDAVTGQVSLDRRGSAGSPGVHRPAPVAPDRLAEAERACRRQAERQGLGLRAILSSAPVHGRGGDLTGAIVVLRVGRGGQVYPVRCAYEFASRRARITNT